MRSENSQLKKIAFYGLNTGPNKFKFSHEQADIIYEWMTKQWIDLPCSVGEKYLGRSPDEHGRCLHWVRKPQSEVWSRSEGIYAVGIMRITWYTRVRRTSSLSVEIVDSSNQVITHEMDMKPTRNPQGAFTSNWSGFRRDIDCSMIWCQTGTETPKSFFDVGAISVEIEAAVRKVLQRKQSHPNTEWRGL